MRLGYGWLPAQRANSTCLAGIRLPVLECPPRRVFVNQQGSETHSLRTDGVRDMAGQTVPTTSNSRIAQRTSVSGSRDSEAKITSSSAYHQKSTFHPTPAHTQTHTHTP